MPNEPGQPARPAAASRGFVLALLLLCGVATVGLHLNSFFVTHGEGDEWVYLTLAHEMNWDLTHYTTRDHPRVSDYPFAGYRAPVFIHPPLYPYVLKVGLALGQPLAVGLLFQLAAMLLLLAVVARWLWRTGVDGPGVAVVLVGLTFCPLLLAATTRLHLDGLGAVFCAAAVLFFLEALERPNWRAAVAAGVLAVLALNVRYSSLVLAPFLVLVQVGYLWQRHRAAGLAAQTPGPPTRAGWAHWRAFGIVMALVLTLGLQHYYRVYLACGTLDPGQLHGLDPGRTNAFLEGVLHRPRAEALLFLVLTFPFLLAFVSGAAWRGWRALGQPGRLEAALLPAAAYFLGCCLCFQHILERYFALAMPFIYLCLPLLFRHARRWERLALVVLLALSFASMLATDYEVTFDEPVSTRVWPAVLYYFEPLRSSCR